MQRVVSHLAVKALVGYLATLNERVTTLNLSHDKCGRVTLVTAREGVMKPARWVLQRLQLAI